MRPLPLRTRLAVWYCAVLATTVVAFSVFALVEMRNTIGGSVDAELRDRLGGFRKLLLKQPPGDSPRGLAAALAEHTGGNDLIRIADRNGAWVYRSPAVDSLEAQLPPVGNVAQPTTIVTIRAGGLPMRILTTTLALQGTAYRVQIGENTGPYESTTARFAQVMLAWIPGLLIVAVTGGFWLSRRALLPVDRITRAARQISVRNLSQRLEVPQTRDELQRLSETLNAMLDRIEEAFQRIERFTADASHELKTPLAVMRTMAELPLRHPGSDGEYREALSGIVRELERTSRLVDDLLCVARGDSGSNALKKARIDLIGVLRAAATQVESMASTQRLSFKREICDGSIWVDGDRDALQRLFVILLDNAVKYTPPPGDVTLKAATRDGLACVDVLDTGIGIDDADVPHIFERFYRADKARSRDAQGAGLGLAIARWIALAHGGTLAVESVRGRGSVFTVRLPAIS